MSRQKTTSIILNEDFMHFIMTRHKCGIDVTREVIESFIDQYTGSQVTDFVLNLNASLSYCPSDVLQTSFNKFKQKQENGLPVDYSDTYLALSYDIFINKGLDMYEIMISRLRRNGISPWLSFRMNDIHENSNPTSALASDFRYEAKARGLSRIAHRPLKDYYDICLNFMIDEVRQRWLTYIDEQLERYDADGIELDFMREIFCFCPGDEVAGRKIITGFIRSVKESAARHGTERGHEIKIMVRVPPDPAHAYQLGFDVYTWVKEKLVDILVATPRWATCDSTMPVESWVRMFESDTVEIAAGLEILCANRPDLQIDFHDCFNTPEMARGFAVQYLSAGCDRIYLYNYMDKPSTKGKQRKGTMALGTSFEGIKDVMTESAVAECSYGEVLATIGQLKTSAGLARRHVMTYRDIIPYWEPQKALLPLHIAPLQHRFASIGTGKIPAGCEAVLIIGVGKLTDVGDLSVWCNCRHCRYICETEIFPRYTNNPVIAYEIDHESLKGYSQIIEMASNAGGLIIDYIEIRVQPKKK